MLGLSDRKSWGLIDLGLVAISSTVLQCTNIGRKKNYELVREYEGLFLVSSLEFGNVSHDPCENRCSGLQDLKLRGYVLSMVPPNYV